MYIEVDVDPRDIFNEMSSSDKLDMLREVLSYNSSDFSEVIEYYQFRLRLNPNEYTASEVLSLITDDLERLGAI